LVVGRSFTLMAASRFCPTGKPLTADKVLVVA
jgi:hypothetical protein